MTDKVVRLMLGTEDNSVRCVMSLIFSEEATEDDVLYVLANAAEHAMTRFVDGPHEEAGPPK